MNGEVETGITTFLLDEQIDTGNILLQEKVSISPDETVGELHDDLMRLGAKLTLETIRGIAFGTLSPIPQPNTEATHAPKIFPEDCDIRFDRSVNEVHNQIRGLSPHPAAFTLLPNGDRTKIYRSRMPSEVKNIEAGTWEVSEDSKHIYVGTSTTPIEILELQREGKKRMTADEFLRGSKQLITQNS